VKGIPVNIPSKTGPMVIEFWASWCGPCRMAFPHLSDLQRKYKDKGLRVVGICLEDDVSAAR
jgi:thiol-disulfide isomerase/thioredoxin